MNKELINKLKTADLSEADVKEVKKLCRMMGVGKSKKVLTIEEQKNKWLSSADAKRVLKKYPKFKQSAVSIFNVARGAGKRPAYVKDDDDFYDDMLDTITEKYL